VVQSSPLLEEIADRRDLAGWFHQLEDWIPWIDGTKEGHSNALNGIMDNLAIPTRRYADSKLFGNG
jgi:hypothetical protein